MKPRGAPPQLPRAAYPPPRSKGLTDSPKKSHSRRGASLSDQRELRILFPPLGPYPRIIGIVRSRHGTRRSRKGVEVVHIVTVCGHNPVVAFWHQHQFAMSHRQRCVNPPVCRIHLLYRIAFRAPNSVVVDLFEIYLVRRVVHIVLVGGDSSTNCRPVYTPLRP